MNTSHFDVHQRITNQITSAIEAGAGDFKLPWHRPSADLVSPKNIASKAAYRGVNILSLWLSAETKGFTSGIWGSFNQWASLGATVRKGQKATYVVFYKQIKATTADDKDERESRRIARATPVFAAEQVDGYELEATLPKPKSEFQRSDEIDAFVRKSDATIYHGGSQAYYQPSTDSIHLPFREMFLGTETSSPEESYYSTLFHELTHFSGAKGRCDRDLTGRFGSSAYAMEELIAELGAAFLCGQFQISAAPRADHAQYLAHWLSVLKSDKRAIFTAASKASQAVDYLTRVAVS